MGFLTKEERLVFLTLSVCLMAGGVFQFINSVFELPEEITPPDDGRPSLALLGESGINDGVSGSDADKADDLLTSGGSGGTISRNARSSETGPSSTESIVLSAKLDLNKATAQELDALPGIGPSLASRIIEQRRITGGFRSVEDLLAVRGIGKKTLAKFRPWVYAGSPK